MSYEFLKIIFEWQKKCILLKILWRALRRHGWIHPLRRLNVSIVI
jgi:hypothetical protein